MFSYTLFSHLTLELQVCEIDELNSEIGMIDSFDPFQCWLTILLEKNK